MFCLFLFLLVFQIIVSILVFKYHVHSNYSKLCTSFLWVSDSYTPAYSRYPFHYLANIYKFKYPNSTLNFLIKNGSLWVYLSKDLSLTVELFSKPSFFLSALNQDQQVPSAPLPNIFSIQPLLLNSLKWL